MQLGFEFSITENETSQYSIAICPPQEVVKYFVRLKLELFKEIGKYGSRNSEVHCTFNVFEALEQQLATTESFLELFVLQLKPIELRFNNIGSFKGANAFFVGPDESTKEFLKPVMQKFKRAFPHKGSFSTEPHLSLGRRLNDKQLLLAHELFKDRKIDFSFVWDNLAIRKFDPKRGQYNIYKRFYL
jgi:hypothetical protein